MPQCDLRKAAVVLASLPAESSAHLLARLTARQVEAVAREIAQLDVISAADQAAALRDFAESEASNAGSARAGLALAHELLETALGCDASRSMATLRLQAGQAPFEFLQDLTAPQIHQLLIDEHPQTIALVVSQISPSKSAQVLGRFPVEAGRAIARRIALIEPLDPTLLGLVADGLRHRLQTTSSAGVEPLDGWACVARILSAADKTVEANLIQGFIGDEFQPQVAPPPAVSAAA